MQHVGAYEWTNSHGSSSSYLSIASIERTRGREYVYLHCCAFNIRRQCYFDKKNVKGIVDFSRFLNHSDITPLFMSDLKRQRRRPKKVGGWVGCVCGCLCNKKVRKKNDCTQEPSFVSLCCPFLLSFFLSLFLSLSLSFNS